MFVAVYGEESNVDIDSRAQEDGTEQKPVSAGTTPAMIMMDLVDRSAPGHPQAQSRSPFAGQTQSDSYLTLPTTVLRENQFPAESADALSEQQHFYRGKDKAALYAHTQSRAISSMPGGRKRSFAEGDEEAPDAQGRSTSRHGEGSQAANESSDSSPSSVSGALPRKNNYQRQHNVPSASGQPMGTSSVQSYNNYTDHDQSYSRVIGGLASSMGDGPGNSLLQGDSTRSTSAAASTTGPTSGSGQATGAESSQISKRTLQNRKAQREFRQRRAHYLKDLEERVRRYESGQGDGSADLQASIDRLSQDNQYLRAMVARLQHELAGYRAREYQHYNSGPPRPSLSAMNSYDSSIGPPMVGSNPPGTVYSSSYPGQGHMSDDMYHRTASISGPDGSNMPSPFPPSMHTQLSGPGISGSQPPTPGHASGPGGYHRGSTSAMDGEYYGGRPLGNRSMAISHQRTTDDWPPSRGGYAMGSESQSVSSPHEVATGSRGSAWPASSAGYFGVQRPSGLGTPGHPDQYLGGSGAQQPQPTPPLYGTPMSAELAPGASFEYNERRESIQDAHVGNGSGSGLSGPPPDSATSSTFSWGPQPQVPPYGYTGGLTAGGSASQQQSTVRRSPQDSPGLGQG